MKKKGVIIFLVLVLIIVGIVGLKVKRFYSVDNQYKNFKIINYELRTKNYKLLVADTPEKHSKGLIFLRKLDGVQGMIFLFPDKVNRTFWNMNTFMDLDIYWLDDERVVGQDILPSIEKSKSIITVSSPQPANKVIEIPH